MSKWSAVELFQIILEIYEYLSIKTLKAIFAATWNVSNGNATQIQIAKQIWNIAFLSAASFYFLYTCNTRPQGLKMSHNIRLVLNEDLHICYTFTVK